MALLVASTGCATWAERSLAARRAAGAGDYVAAVYRMDYVLGVDSPDELPDDWKGDRPLAALERGVLLQALREYPSSARSLQAAESELELLDLRIDAIGALGEYLYSGSSHTYRTPPSERLALNPINLLNYLAVGDLDGAAVEARRFQVMREFLASLEVSSPEPDALGAYLAGFVFERSGEPARALRYYDEALANGDHPSLHAPIRRLAALTAQRGPRVAALLADTPPAAAGSEAPRGELLIVLALGRVPHRVPARMPLGAAIGYAGAIFTGDLGVLERSVTKVVVYPQLVPSPSRIGAAVVRVDGRRVTLDRVAWLAEAVRSEYEAAKPKLIAAALTRLAARAAIAEGMRAAGRQESHALGTLLALLTEGALVALDRPDTRSWTLLPARILAARVALAPGEHTVEVDYTASGPGAGVVNGRHMVISVPAGGFGAAVITEPR